MSDHPTPEPPSDEPREQCPRCGCKIVGPTPTCVACGWQHLDETLRQAVERLADPVEMERAMYRSSGMREDLLPLAASAAANVLRALLAEHPASEPPSDVTEDRLAEVIAGFDGGRLADATMRAHDACHRAARAILATFHVTPRADA